MRPTIRTIAPTDYSQCTEVLVAAYQGAPWNNNWTTAEARLRIESIMSGANARGFVVEDKGAIVAMCLGRLDYYFEGWCQFCVDEFNVTPPYQGHGVGKDLMSYVANELRRSEVKRIFLLTGGSEAAQFYRKNGFTFAEDDIAMSFDLT